MQEVDLDKTDELPVLDMVKLSAAEADPALLARLDPNATTADTDRHARVDLPSLIDSVQQAEARIAQQSAHQEVLDRELKTAREKIEESTRDILRLTGEAQALRSTLEAREESLAQALRTVGDRDHAVAELRRDLAGIQAKLAEARTAAEQAEQEFAATQGRLTKEHAANRAQLGDELAATRDRLQADLAATRSRLEGELSSTREKLGAELQSARGQIESGRSELAASQRNLSELSARLADGENSLASAQREAEMYRKRSTEFLENLRSNEFRRSNQEDIFRELDARLASAQGEAANAVSQAERLEQQLRSSQADADARSRRNAELESTLAKSAQTLEQQASTLTAADRTRQELDARLRDLEAQITRNGRERTQFVTDLAARDRSLQEERETKSQLQVQLQSLEAAQAEHLARLAELDRRLGDAQQQKRLDDEALQRQAGALESSRADAAAQLGRIATLEGELSATSALLEEVRRPIEDAEAEIRQLRIDLETRGREMETSREEIKHLQTSLERSKGALEEREFLIRRLERSANTSAQVLGRLQSSIERLGTATPLPAAASAEPAAEPSAFHPTLLRIDNGSATTFALGQRTRVGRSPESDVRIESSSVSRHHALIITGARHCIIEDLNSTNGVLVNGRKVNRQKLKDGDTLVIGEAHFKYIESGALSEEPNPVSFAPS
ncbi:MAG: FHA domain-containing protein [Steroidobacteraceae bacterium]